MKIDVAAVVNNPWTVICAVAACFWWLIENKPLIPDELEPHMVAEATVSESQMRAYVDEKYEPVQSDLVALSADFVDRNIPWANKQLAKIQAGEPTEYSAQQIHDYLCGTLGREGQYRRYEKIHGTKHFAEGDYCE
jgi:hypothetical protein